VLDFFGRGFTLLCFGNTADTESFAQAATTRGMPLRIVHIDDPAIANAYERNLVLVRPDGHVAWRGDGSPPDAGTILDRVRGA
jgi:hypothetical protein